MLTNFNIKSYFTEIIMFLFLEKKSILLKSLSILLFILPLSCQVTLAQCTVGAASSAPIVCVNTAITNITHSTTGATDIGTPTGLPAGVSAAWASNILTISGTSSVTGIFNYSIPLTGGGCTVNATGTITVKSIPTTAITGNASFCAGENTLLSANARGGGSITSIAAGGKHSLFFKNDGTVWATGNNQTGELGDVTSDYYTRSPIQIRGLSGITAIEARGSHSLFLKNDGTVWATGYNYFGQLGNGTTKNRNTPIQVSGLSGITAIASGKAHSLFLKNDGTVWATGLNEFGQLGDGTTTNRTTPVQVSGLSGITAIAGGAYHSLFLKNDGIVWATGYNLEGGLGDGTTTNRNTPVQVSGLSGITAIAGGFYHSLFLKNDGTVWATGDNYKGQLGDVTSDYYTISPIQIRGLSGITAIEAGDYHSLFLKNDGTVWATGLNEYGQLGDGTTTNRNTPVQLSVFNLIITSYQWYIGGSSIADANSSTYTATTAGNYTEQVTNSNGCSSTSSAFAVTVTPNNTVGAASSAPTVYVNTAITNITHSTTGATGIGTPTGLPAGVSAAWASNILTISGTPTATGTFNYSIPLIGGCESISATGTIEVTIAASSNADLSAMTISRGILSPSFASTTTAYTASVSNESSSITVTPTKADATASITVNGVAVSSGAASGAINLNVGSNTITVVVTAQDASTKTYTVTITVTVTFPCQNLVTLISPSDDYVSGTYLKVASRSAGKITATNKLTGTTNVIYRAKAIELNAGFKAERGTVFLAEIGGCN